MIMENAAPENFGDTFTICLRRWEAGDTQAYQHLYELVLSEIRRMASRELKRRGGKLTWGTTDLANEIVLRLLKGEQGRWQDKEHFLNTAALAMFQILIDYGRMRRRRLDGQIRFDPEAHEGLDLEDVLLEEQRLSQRDLDKLIDLERAIRKLRDLNARWSAIAVLKLNFGLSAREIADHLNISENTVNNLWPRCKKFLAKELIHWKSSEK
jgi:RNA polymerase sigma factor (TIGR02999 family)